MPGLVGILEMGRERRVDAAVFQRMTASIVHRPWYRVDAHTSPGVALARVHGVVLDSTPQPYVTDDGRLTIFLDGEVYDDAAAGRPLPWIAETYRRHGPDFAAGLNGSFTAIVLDAVESRAVIATDRTASRPLFYWQHGTTLYVAPELKALLAVPALERRLDWRAVAGFLASGFWLNGDTAVDGVRRVDHATVLTLDRDRLRSHRYWDYRLREDAPDRGERQFGEALAGLVRTAVRRRVRSAHRYGILLSGGYDSRGILGCYLAERPDAELITISWGEDEDVPGSDCWVARDVAARVGAKHHFFRLRPEALPDHLEESVYLSDGMTASCGNYPEGLTIFAKIREELGVDVLLRGDECLGWHAGPFDDRTALQSIGIHPLSDLPAYRTLLNPAGHRRLEGLADDLLTEILARCPAGGVHDRKDFLYLDQRLKYYLHPLNAFKTLEVEARRPYLDNDLLDFVTTLPLRYRLDKALFRRTVVGMFPDLFEHVARHWNLVDWHQRLGTDARLQRLVQERLHASRGALAGLLATTAPVTVDPSRRPGGRATTLARGIKRHRWLYQHLRPLYLRLRRRLTARGAAPITPDIVFRLLTLTVWSERFLDGAAPRGPSAQEISACVASPER